MRQPHLNMTTYTAYNERFLTMFQTDPSLLLVGAIFRSSFSESHTQARSC